MTAILQMKFVFGYCPHFCAHVHRIMDTWMGLMWEYVMLFYASNNLFRSI